MMCSKSERFLAIVLISSYWLLATRTTCAGGVLTLVKIFLRSSSFSSVALCSRKKRALSLGPAMFVVLSLVMQQRRSQEKLRSSKKSKPHQPIMMPAWPAAANPDLTAGAPSGERRVFCIGVFVHHALSFHSFFFLLGDTRIVLPIDLRWRPNPETATRSHLCVLSAHLRSAPQAHGQQFNGKWVSYTHTAMAYSMFWISCSNGPC